MKMAVQTVKVVREEGGGCGEEIEQHFESLKFEEEFATPMSTALTRLDLSFSLLDLKTLRSLLLRPSSPQPPNSRYSQLCNLSQALPCLSTSPHLHTLRHARRLI